MTKIYVAGHTGLVGSTIVRELLKGGTPEQDIVVRTHAELDLTRQEQVEQFFRETAIGQVYFAAAQVGGVVANDRYPADFIYRNLMMQTNTIEAARQAGVTRFLMIGSTCIYPRETAQPIPESALMTGPLEATNEAYAVAKIAGLQMIASYRRQLGLDYRAVLPCNVYGPGDRYNPENGHVVAGMIQRFHTAKINGLPAVAVWGTGRPRREFLYSEDMAQGCITAMTADPEQWNRIVTERQAYVNLSTGTDITVKELAETVASVIGYQGQIGWDTARPDGTLLKCTDNTKMLALGWQPRTSLRQGLQQTYQAYLEIL